MSKVERIGSFLGWGSLIGSFAAFYLSAQPYGLHLAAGTLNFFSYFSVMTAIMVSMAFTRPERNRHPSRRGAVALYAVVMGLVYFLLLRHRWHTHGLGWVSELVMHYVLPPLYLYEWLRLPRNEPLPWRHAFYWLSFPAFYAIYTLLHGALSGFYPYYFLDVRKLGYPGVLSNMIVLAGVFLGIGLLLIAVDRRRRH